jgi:hypothetical protein
MYAMLSRGGVSFGLAIGRSWARSKMAPRSTKNGSSRGPAKTDPPPAPASGAPAPVRLPIVPFVLPGSPHVFS